MRHDSSEEAFIAGVHMSAWQSDNVSIFVRAQLTCDSRPCGGPASGVGSGRIGGEMSPLLGVVILAYWLIMLVEAPVAFRNVTRLTFPWHMSCSRNCWWKSTSWYRGAMSTQCGSCAACCILASMTTCAGDRPHYQWLTDSPQ